jgi:hypothetical protein
MDAMGVRNGRNVRTVEVGAYKTITFGLSNPPHEADERR